MVLACALAAGCLGSGRAAGPAARDDRLLAELRRQERWARESVADRASREELQAAQAGDVDAQADLRQRFRKLLRAAERATWVREATPAALARRGEGSSAELVAAFDRAARLRRDAWDAADQIAETLCALPGPGALSLGDLRRGLATMRAAERVEKRLSRAAASPAAPSPAGPPPAAPSPAGPSPAAREPVLAPTAAPVPRPFIEAAALLLEGHPAEGASLRAFQPGLSDEAAQIRAALADLRARRPPPGSAESEAEGPPPAGGTGRAASGADAGPP
ncbi:MAG: hypothetical protein NVSMB23_00210 [Myxococcales bacterium]